MAAVPGLAVLPRFPSPGTGTGQRSLLLLDAAVRIGPLHVVLLDGTGPLAELEARPGIASVTVLHSESIAPRGRFRGRLLGAIRLIRPGQAYRTDPALQAALRRLVAGTGASFALFRYARVFCAAGLDGPADPPALVDVDDRDDQKYASRLARLVGPRLGSAGPARLLLARLAALLRRRLSRAALVWFAAPDDVWDLAPAETRVLSNVPHSVPEVPPPPVPQSRIVLFVGTFAHTPNQDGVAWFLETCWARIRARCPEAEFRIVGFGNWASLAPAHSGLEGVAYVGGVEDLGAEYAAARVCICPVREGGGSKIKVVEAAGHARPVVVTPHALRGFDAGLAGAAAVAGTPAAFADAVLHYLDDAEAAARSGAALRDCQVRHYSRAAALDTIAAELRRTLGLGRPVAPPSMPAEAAP